MSIPFADLVTILPELLVVGIACLILVLDPITPTGKKDFLAWMSLGVLGVCALVTMSGFGGSVGAFSGLVVVDAYAAFWKMLLYLVSGLTILLSMSYLKEEKIDLAEYYAFVLLALAGMMVMVSGADLLTIYLGIELMSITLYIMAGFKRFEARSIEASAKYFVLGAFSSGILLYGISLLFGVTGSTRLTEIAAAVNGPALDDPLMLLALMLIIVGFGFKVAAVPFHMWTPDVYEGAPTSVTAFMAVASKAASFAAFLRVLLEAFGGVKPNWNVLILGVCLVTVALGNLVAIVITVVVLSYAVKWWKATPFGTRIVDRWTLRVPLLGRLAHLFALSQFTRSLSVLLSGGTPMVPSLETASTSVKNAYISELFLGCVQEVQEGRPLSDALDDTGRVPGLALAMIRVGESTGALPEMLEHTSDFFDEEIEFFLTRIVTLFEPAILVVMAVIIAGLLLAVYYPLLRLVSTIA